MQLKNILVTSKQSIDFKKYEHPTGTLSMTFLKPAGGANPYFRIVYMFFDQKLLSDKWQQISQQSTMFQSKVKLQRKFVEFIRRM